MRCSVQRWGSCGYRRWRMRLPYQLTGVQGDDGFRHHPVAIVASKEVESHWVDQPMQECPQKINNTTVLEQQPGV